MAEPVSDYRFLPDVESARDFAESIVQAVREPLLVLDANLRVLLANRAFYRYFAVSFLDTEGQRVYDLGNGQWNIPVLRRLLEEVMRENHAFEDFRVEHEFPGIGRRVLLLNARKIIQPGTAQEALLLAFEDVTEQGIEDRERGAITSALQESADALQSSEKRYRALSEVAPLVIWTSQPDGRITYANQFWYDYTGMTPEETQGDGWMSAIHPEDQKRAHAFWVEAVERGTDYEIDIRFRRAVDGEYRWFLARGVPIRRAEDGEILQWSGVALDIHEGKTAADEVRFAEQRLRLATTSANIGTWDLNPVTGELFWDERCRAAFGYPLDRPIDYPTCLSLIHPDDREPTDAAVQAALSPEGTGEYSVEFRTIGFRDQIERWVIVTGRAEFNETHTETLRFIGTIQDITERKHSEEILRDARARSEAILTAAEVGTWTFDLVNDRVVADANLARLFFVSPEDAAGGRLAAYLAAIHDEDRDRVISQINDAAANRDSFESDYRVVSRDGVVRWLEARGRITRDESGTAIALPGVVLDITARKQLEAEREKLLADTRSRAEREQLINNVGQAIRAAGWDAEEALSRAVALVGEAIGVDRCYFAVYDSSRPVFHVGRDWHRADLTTMEGEYFIADYASVNAELYASGRMVNVFSDLETAPLSEESKDVFRHFHMRAFLGIVLVNDKGKMVASLRVAMADVPRDWTPDEIALIESVANIIYTGMEVVRVAQRERNIAWQLQEALQPPPPPRIPRLAVEWFYRPALEEASVGGDFYDIFPIEGGCTALIVADLAGKGLSAASQVAMVRNMLRYALYTNRSISDAINSLSRILVNYDLLTGFTTLFAGVYDPGTQELRYVNCGQEPGLVWRKETGAIEKMMSTGSVLGGFAVEPYTEEAVQLETGDVVALFTDGITEIGPTRRELLGVDGVEDLLRSSIANSTAASPEESAAQITASLIDGVDAYARDGVRDDVCLLVGIVTGR